MQKSILRAAVFVVITALLCIGCNDSGAGIGSQSDGDVDVDMFLGLFTGKSVYTLTVDANPAAGGSVSRNPDRTYYRAGTVVTVTATTANGYTFTGWSGASTATANTITITMDGNKALTANFQEPAYSLTVSANPETWGAVSRSPSQTNYTAGTRVIVMATAYNGYKFTNWVGASSSTNSSVEITMDGDKMLVANFQPETDTPPPPPDTYTLTVNANPAIGGSVSRAPDKTSYTNGETVTVTASPAAGYEFTGWSGSLTATDTSVTITMDANKALTAGFQQQNVIIPPAIEGIMVSGSNLTAKLAELQRIADSHNTYILEMNANENIIPHTLFYTGAINVTIVLRGDGINRIIRLSNNGTMFTVRSNVTFVLDNNIALQGHNGNTGTMVNVNGGTFIMNTGSAITGNIRTANNSGGGGVYVGSGTFEMNGGVISGNTASSGGGVYLSSGTFTMRDGAISGNTANNGGGLYVGGTFTMRGGIITGNTAREYGGGVYKYNYGGTFTKVGGGTITGYYSDPGSGNIVRDQYDREVNRRGHAVYVSSTRRQEATAGPGLDLSSGSDAGWDNGVDNYSSSTFK